MPASKSSPALRKLSSHILFKIACSPGVDLTRDGRFVILSPQHGLTVVVECLGGSFPASFADRPPTARKPHWLHDATPPSLTLSVRSGQTQACRRGRCVRMEVSQGTKAHDTTQQLGEQTSCHRNDRFPETTRYSQ